MKPKWMKHGKRLQDVAAANEKKRIINQIKANQELADMQMASHCRMMNYLRSGDMEDLYPSIKEVIG